MAQAEIQDFEITFILVLSRVDVSNWIKNKYVNFKQKCHVYVLYYRMKSYKQID